MTFTRGFTMNKLGKEWTHLKSLVMNRSEESTCNARADHTESNREAFFLYIFFFFRKYKGIDNCRVNSMPLEHEPEEIINSDHKDFRTSFFLREESSF